MMPFLWQGLTETFSSHLFLGLGFWQAFALLLGICHLLFGISMLIRIMHSFLVFFAVFLVRLLCFWLQRFLGDYVGLESLVDSCWVCGQVVLRDHSNLDYVTFVCRLILIISVIASCELVLISLFLVIFGKDFCGQTAFLDT